MNSVDTLLDFNPDLDPDVSFSVDQFDAPWISTLILMKTFFLLENPKKQKPESDAWLAIKFSTDWKGYSIYVLYAYIIQISLHLLYMNPPNPSQIATLPGSFSKSWQWPKAIKSIDLASDVATHNAVLSSCSQSSSWSQVGVDVFVKDIGDYNPKKPIHDNTTKL